MADKFCVLCPTLKCLPSIGRTDNGRAGEQTNTTHYIVPHVTRLDQKGWREGDGESRNEDKKKDREVETEEGEVEEEEKKKKKKMLIVVMEVVVGL